MRRILRRIACFFVGHKRWHKMTVDRVEHPTLWVTDKDATFGEGESTLTVAASAGFASGMDVRITAARCLRCGKAAK